MTNIIAHILQKADGSFETQSLTEHAEGVAKLAGQFATEVGGKRMGQLGWMLGLLHDVGKALPSFQTYIRCSAGMEVGEPVPSPHSPVGAIYANQFQTIHDEGLRKLLSLIVSAHHRGLYDDADWQALVGDSKGSGYLSACKQLVSILTNNDFSSGDFDENKLLKSFRGYDSEDRSMLIRMLFSCLVDADFIDTEHFMSPGYEELRTHKYPSFETLRDCLRDYTNRFQQDTPINKVRSQFLQTCKSEGQKAENGVYSLFLPTGGGKTLSSMAWALENVVAHRKSRIIYVIPYTSIISQTAQTFREIFGASCVLEHHSDVDFMDENEEEQLRQKLATENWDAPIIVTTNVQFFESLYSNRVGRCRKLHNICNSVVVFDEVQTFPPSLENPIVSALESLTYSFGVTALLCTATLPIFDQEVGSDVVKDQRFFSFDEPVEPVVPYDKKLFSVFDKVDFHLDPLKTDTVGLAKELLKHDSFLCVVNSRKDALDLYETLLQESGSDDGLIHLSKRMCSLHIKERIAEIRRRLLAGSPTKVVSTQLIEAGVDLDFPVVYRALSGLDSIIQAAGRCNREGRLAQKGLLQVFDLEGSKIKGELGFAQNATKEVVRRLNGSFDPNNLETIKAYFASFYRRIHDFDQERVSEALQGDNRAERLKYDFETAANRFRYIKDNSVTVVVPYGEDGRRLCDKLQRGSYLNKEDYRLMAKLSVGLYDREVTGLKQCGLASDVVVGSDQIIVLCDPKSYDGRMGIKLTNPYTVEECCI